MNQQDPTRVPVTIFGRKYTLKSSEGMPRERILAIVNEVNERMDKLASQFPRLDFAQVAVMTAMNLTEEKKQLEEKQQAAVQEQENRQDVLAVGELKAEFDQLKADHSKLQLEYEKLKTEYNEWIQLTEDGWSGEDS